ncbi:MAG: class I SAM-dependent DNA methyltransferase [Candidatus Binatia bacterium]
MSLGQHHSDASHLRPYLVDCGYQTSQLETNVEVADDCRVPLAAFARRPHDSRSACIAVLDNVSDPEVTVSKCRDLGAPVVFAYSADSWLFWKQGTSKPQFLQRILPAELPKFFQEHRAELAPEAIYRAKTWARFEKSYQLDFIDVGLMPLVEEQAGRKLAELIERCVALVKTRLHWTEVSQPQGHWLLKSNFWLLAAKILKDKRVPTFAALDLEDVQKVFAHVTRHYGAVEPVQIETQRQANALKESAREISRCSHLGLVSTDALGYLYENALITKEVRTTLGTHSTPTYLVDYMVGKLRPWIEEIPENQRQVFEPACGHAPFLLAAMQLLGDLLSERESSSSKRREYLRKRLHGCDIDSFALEIARLRLTLADVPNPNGWDLQVSDIFTEGVLARGSHGANIILTNPPFKNLSVAERHINSSSSTQTQHVNKAAEIFGRIVTHMQPGAVFGVILPQGILHSKNATSLRQLLVTHFEISEICLLPDKVFSSDAESVVILGRRLESNQRNTHPILYRRVRESGIENFRRSYAATYESEFQPRRFSAADKWNFFVPDLEEVWEYCQNLPRFGEIATIGKGFDFLSHTDPAFPSNTLTMSTEPRQKFVKGFVRLNSSLQTHELPEAIWINLDSSVVKTRRYGTTTGIPQVLLNYAPVSREPWRLKACLDKAGHPVTSRFLVIRPRDTRWPLEALWGICNSPFANAYSYAFSTKRDVLAGLVRKMPIPDVNSVNVSPLVEAVTAYLKATHTVGVANTPDKLKVLHWRIDAEVLRLYALPPHLERQLLDLFAGVERRGVPFVQKEYFPKEFTDLSTLSELLAITVDWDHTNERRAQLIEKKVKKHIASEEKRELDYLQQLTDARIQLLAPLPIKQLEDIRDDLKRRGIWVGE